MQITRIQIFDLFGMFKHDIRLKIDDRITIIHGPNGVGKTTVLKLISDIFSQRFSTVAFVPFTKVIINFKPNALLIVEKILHPESKNAADIKIIYQKKSGYKLAASSLHALRDEGVSEGLIKELKNIEEQEFPSKKLFVIAIEKHVKYEISNEEHSLILRYAKRENQKRHVQIISDSMREAQFERHLPLQVIDDIIPQLERTGSRRWLDRETGDFLSLEDVIVRYGALLPLPIRELQNLPEEITEALDSMKIYFIQTQRLFATPQNVDVYRGSSRRRTKTRTSVEKYSEEMAERIQDLLTISGSVAASLDRRFPHRLLTSKLPKEATEEKIRSIYQEQSSYRDRLMIAGLIDAEEQVSLPDEDLDSTERKVLWYYFKDVDAKLEVFDELLKKVELFKDIINSRFLYKSFRIDKKAGFVFQSEKGKKVPLRSLSSGEQHELVLAYELLFKVSGKSFILIDEPELSLHVTWQHKFLDDLERISQLADLDFLIATHSPSIIHKRRSLMVALSEDIIDAG